MYLPDAKIKMGVTVWAGSILTAFLFEFANIFLGYYFFHLRKPGSNIMAPPGSIHFYFLLLDFLFCLFLFGANFTKVCALIMDGIIPYENFYAR